MMIVLLLFLSFLVALYMNLQKLTKNRLHELLQMSVGLGGFSQKLLASCKYWIYLGYLFVEGTQLPMIVLLLYLCFLVAVYMHFYKLVGNLPQRTNCCVGCVLVDDGVVGTWLPYFLTSL